jgi:hypothetical protein
VEIKFTPLDEGGLGFQTAEEVRRRSSAAVVASPRLLGQTQRDIREEEMMIEEVVLHDHTSCHVSPDLKPLEPKFTAVVDTDP